MTAFSKSNILSNSSNLRAGAALLALAWPLAVQSQTQPPEIVVTGQAPATRSLIDRKSYRISNDLQSAAGSASDVLRNLPSVDVDAQGAISIRGDSNVQVLIDGRPSTTMSNALRGDALEQFPANTIDRIEVITNPSARFKAEGSGGIINIITRRDGKRGLSVATNASAGTDGRYTIAGNATYRNGPLTATASLTWRRDVRWRPFSDRRTDIDPVTGARTASEQDSLFHGEKISRIAKGNVDYELTTADRLSAGGSYNHRTGTPLLTQHDRTLDPTGAVTSDFDRTGTGHENEVSDEATLKYKHGFAAKDRWLAIDLRRGETIENEARRFTNLYRIPAGLVTIDQQTPRLDLLQRQATVEYSQPLAKGVLLAGYDLQRDDNDFRNLGLLIDPLTGAATNDPARSYGFVYGQTVHAFYGTFDRTFGKRLSASLGLRLEHTHIRTRDGATGVAAGQEYLKAFPTLHLSYPLDAGTLKFSFGNRLVRPDPEDLNPHTVFSDPLNLKAGNPGLKPQQTRVFEAAYQRDRSGLALEATLFLRQTRNAFTEVTRFVTPTVLLTTKENLGRSTAYGLDLTGSGKLSPALGYRISATLAHTTIDASNLGFAGSRSTISASGKAGLDFKLAAADLVQLSGTLNGKRLTPQGYRLPSAALNFGYRHSFHSGLTAVLSVSDILQSQHDRLRIDSATIVEASVRRNVRRVASLALSMPFGGGRAPEPGFDYASSGGGN
jgi:outer membrane receptor protein involved in Fe transport